GAQQPAQPTFAGRVLILSNCGRFQGDVRVLVWGPFSQACDVDRRGIGRRVLRQLLCAIPGVPLPYTKGVVQVPLVTYSMAVSGYQDASRGVIPDQSGALRHRRTAGGDRHGPGRRVGAGPQTEVIIPSPATNDRPGFRKPPALCPGSVGWSLLC